MRGIYAIVDAALSGDPEHVVDAVLRGGVRLVQYRAKAGVERSVVRRLHRATSRVDALLIVNDDPAAAGDADGLHVGQEDLQEIGSRLRERLSSRILGISCGLPEEARAATRLGADYVGVGPFATTSSKGDAGPPIGARGLAAVVAAARPLPVAAIGGLGLGDLAVVAACGARMAAVLSALVRDGDPQTSARAFVEAWRRVDR